MPLISLSPHAPMPDPLSSPAIPESISTPAPSASGTPLFGTDGIRTRVGWEPLTENGMHTLGRTLRTFLEAKQPQAPASHLSPSTRAQQVQDLQNHIHTLLQQLACPAHSVVEPATSTRGPEASALDLLALRQQWTAQKRAPWVLIGHDTRHSCQTLLPPLIQGLEPHIVVIQAGCVPTPCIGLLSFLLCPDMALMMTASHNPATDNGLKFFRDGHKISPITEQQLQKLYAQVQTEPVPTPLPVTHVHTQSLCAKDNLSPQLAQIYRAVACKQFTQKCSTAPTPLAAHQAPLQGLKLVLDCANGAFFQLAPSILTDLGATVQCLGHTPNGQNINDRCGAVHPHKLQEAVRKTHAHMGIGFDGDGDRLLLVDAKGDILSGDQILALVAHYLHTTKAPLTGVVGTVLSDLSVEHYVKSLGIPFYRSAVGDRNVGHMMAQTQSELGGEPSGHILRFNHFAAGDALQNALLVLSALLWHQKQSKANQPQGQSQSALSSASKPTDLWWAERHILRQALPPLLPTQCLHTSHRMGTPAASQTADVCSALRILSPAMQEKLLSHPHLQALRADCAKTLGPNGRIIVRFSGTEPLLRLTLQSFQTTVDLRTCALPFTQFLSNSAKPAHHARDPANLIVCPHCPTYAPTPTPLIFTLHIWRRIRIKMPTLTALLHTVGLTQAPHRNPLFYGAIGGWILCVLLLSACGAVQWSAHTHWQIGVLTGLCGIWCAFATPNAPSNQTHTRLPSQPLLSLRQQFHQTLWICTIFAVHNHMATQHTDHWSHFLQFGCHLCCTLSTLWLWHQLKRSLCLSRTCQHLRLATHQLHLQLYRLLRALWAQTRTLLSRTCQYLRLAAHQLHLQLYRLLRALWAQTRTLLSRTCQYLRLAAHQLHLQLYRLLRALLSRTCQHLRLAAHHLHLQLYRFLRALWAQTRTLLSRTRQHLRLAAHQLHLQLYRLLRALWAQTRTLLSRTCQYLRLAAHQLHLQLYRLLRALWAQTRTLLSRTCQYLRSKRQPQKRHTRQMIYLYALSLIFRLHTYMKRTIHLLRGKWRPK